MTFERKATVGLYITTYEISEENEYMPILSHIFWGKDIKQALNYAKSHLVTDAFFNGSFIGELPWKDTILYLDNDGQIVSSQYMDERTERRNIDSAFRELTARAQVIRKDLDRMGVIQTIQRISNKEVS